MMHVYLNAPCLCVDFIETIKLSVLLLSSKAMKPFARFLAFNRRDGKVYMKGDAKYFKFLIVQNFLLFLGTHFIGCITHARLNPHSLIVRCWFI
jgi:hypothetical protein